MTSPEPISTFEELKASYESIWSAGVLKEEECYYRQIVRLLEARPGRRLLDVACGEGSLLTAARKAGLITYGLDISEAALDRCRKVCPDAQVTQGVGEHLPYPDRYFDYVTCLGSLEHFLDPAAGLREMRRVLQDDGRSCVVLPNQWALTDVLSGWVAGRSLGQLQELARFYSLNDARELLRGDGEFWVERVQGYNVPLEDVKLGKRLEGIWDRPYFWFYQRMRHRIPLSLSYVFIFLMRKFPPWAPWRFKLGDPTDELYLVPSGWYWAESGPPPFRWSKETASLFLQTGSYAKSLCLTVLDNSPAGAFPQARLTLQVDEWIDLGEYAIRTGEWESLRCDLPPEARGKVIKLTISVNRTWSPKEALGTVDWRELGWPCGRFGQSRS